MKRLPGERAAHARLALKIAARSSLRSLGRSALIASMVALPVAGIAGIAVVYDSARNPTVSETLTTVLGQTEAQLVVTDLPGSGMEQDPHSHAIQNNESSPTDQEPLSSPAEALPAGTRIIEIRPTSVTLDTAAGRATVDALEGDSWDGSLAGRYDVRDGRAPMNDQEIMVTGSLLTRLGAAVGDSVELRSPIQKTVSIVGLLDDQTRPNSAQVIFTRAGVITGGERAASWDTAFYLPDLTLTWDDVQELNTYGVTAISRDVLLNGPPAVSLVGSTNDLAIAAMIAMVAAFAAFEVILLAGAAFTVTARQQQRMLATVASVGAPRQLLFRVLAASGVVLGFVGGVLGCLVGVVAAIGYMVVTDDGSSTQYYGTHIPWLALVGSVAFAVLVGWAASLMPARNASRFDIVAALRGARKPPTPDRRTPLLGIVMMMTGLALTLGGGILLAVLIEAGRGIGGGHPLLWLPIGMMIVGPLVIQVGLMMYGPSLLRIIALAFSASGIGPRLAARDVARNPSRAVPALAAIMTTVFVSIITMCLISAGEVNSRAEHEYRAMVGQTRVDLRYIEGAPAGELGKVSTYADAAAVAEILRTSLDNPDVRVLSYVADAVELGYDENGNPLSVEGATAVAVVPPSNLCPLDALSPDYDVNFASSNSAEYDEISEHDERCQQSYLQLGGGQSGHIYVGTSDDLSLVLGREASRSAVATLETGGAVALYSQYVANDRFTISWWDTADVLGMGYGEDPGAPVRSEILDAVVELPEHPIDYGVFVSRETADRLELEYEPAAVVAAAGPEIPTSEQQDALNAALSTLPGVPQGYIYAQIETGPPVYAAIWAWGLLALAGIITLASAAVAIGLARVDGRQDDATLASLGAAPRIRRSFAFWQALIIAGVGTFVGTAIGLVPAYALSANPHMPFSPPWVQIALIVVALPLLISVGSWLLTRGIRVSARRLTIG